MTGSRQVNVRFPEELLAEIEEWAGHEMRDRSQMIRVLVVEALAARTGTMKPAPTKGG